ncbi:MAG: AAA family ATPase [Candidatus Gracilibacteria bacterium]|jgi:predicted ATP-dependent endonuclease of OLD family
MIIQNITIQNYRGIRDKQEIPLSNFSSIVGKNDSGKSIILHAIASFLDPKSYQIVESDFHDSSKAIVIECRMFDEELRPVLEQKLKSKFKKEEGLEEFLADIIFDNTILIKKEYSTVGKACSATKVSMKDFDNEKLSNLYERTDEELSALLTEFSISVPVSGTGRNSKLEKIKFIKKYCLDNSIPSKNVWIEDDYKMNEILPEVELFVSDYGLEADTKFKTNSVAEIQDFFKEETKDESSRLSVLEKDIKSKMCLEAENIKKYMLDYTSSLKQVVISPTVIWPKVIDSVDVSFQFDGDSKPIQMSHKGAGYRRLFMVARFRYLAEKNKGQNIVYLIEEPETFLHPSAQSDLLSSFEDLSGENQIIITTHSPVFAGSTNYEAVVLCRKDGQSIYETVAKDGNKNAFINKIVEELGIKPHYNLVDKFEKILFVESKNDVEFYDILCEKILGTRLSALEKILCLPFNGDTIDSFINIDYFERSGRDLYLIIDSDKHVSKEKHELQKTRKDNFDKKPKGKAYLLQKSCIENYYHPRVIESLYKLEADSVNIFNDDENVSESINKIVKEKSVQIKSKNNFDIFNAMTKDQWEEIVEADLSTFLKGILGLS